jgi:rubredoxin
MARDYDPDLGGYRCDRCGGRDFYRTMSFYSTELVCSECSALERALPSFPQARGAEIAWSRSGGGVPYPGFGVPRGLRAAARRARSTREAKS